ncbi:hypothetical protein OG984_02985 [Nocardioides sp. NBC_00368]|uniref:hypothetical protein n=1 Tax=Nocardioides sp. NBC_00368 TaxID=2976000 RepID=UPI002E238DDD
MFEILKILRDLNLKRAIDWHVEEDTEAGTGASSGTSSGCHEIVVRIPIDDDDLRMVHDMRALFVPAEPG